MRNALADDVDALDAELAGDEPVIEVTLRLPRASAQKVLALLRAEQSAGAVVIPARPEFTTTEAAQILGMSRPTLMRLIDAGRIRFRKVGKHHRIPASAIQEFRDRQHDEGDPMTVVAALANKYGNID